LEECLTDLEWLPAKGYILLITDAAHVLSDDETEYETFLEILRDAGEAWGNGQAEMGVQRATPFHVLFAVSEREKAKRAHWGMNEINAEPTREAGIQRGLPQNGTKGSARLGASSGYVQQACPAESAEDNPVAICAECESCSAASTSAMNDANPMCFARREPSPTSSFLPVGTTATISSLIPN
jgi:hypothetical protein